MKFTGVVAVTGDLELHCNIASHAQTSIHGCKLVNLSTEQTLTITNSQLLELHKALTALLRIQGRI